MDNILLPQDLMTAACTWEEFQAAVGRGHQAVAKEMKMAKTDSDKLLRLQYELHVKMHEEIEATMQVGKIIIVYYKDQNSRHTVFYLSSFCCSAH